MTRPLRILVSDDDTDNADSLGELLTLEGHRARIAYTGDDAAKTLAGDVFDLVLLAATLPGRDGLESFAEIKRAQPSARSYMVTGNSIGQLLRQAVGSGSLEIMEAPPQPDRLLTAIRNASPSGIVLVAKPGLGAGQILVGEFKELDHEAEHITDPATALSVIEERRVHVLILDLDLPLIDSIGVYKALDSAGRAKPTIILAKPWDGHATLDDAARTGVITKPFDPKLLVTRLEQLAA